MDAVLPLRLKDFERATLLFDSLTRNFPKLARLWLVCPDRHYDEVRTRAQSLSHGFELRVEPETPIVPELELAEFMGGWYRQQMVKLAMAERVASELYLTLDADVVCTRRVSPEKRRWQSCTQPKRRST